ncbi:hypothetical protein [Methylophilus sp.]|uniref:hypothetical protein n=1 Tax=Methylophilus sp. TaxID=29541 RepID=UPI000D4BD2B4|nr:hypothetical protein [Methylophilus sp.]PPD12172.1 MAG: hypothetical protein CTY26_06160 [Methylophilus sp.]
MTTPHLEATNPAPLLVGVGAILHGALQPELIVCFMCAVIGAGIGMAFLPAPAPAKNRNELLVRFAGNAIFVLIIAVVAMFGLPFLPNWILAAKYPASFFFSMGLMLGRDRIIAGVGRWFDRKLDGV